MKVIISYILNMMPYMLISIPIFMLVRYLIYKKTKIFNLKREILLLIFYLFLVGLFSQTIIPKYDSNNNIIVSKVRLNLIPFKIIYDTIIELKKGNIYYLIISLLGNIVMFIPIGFFIKLLYRYNDKKIVLIGFLISLSIEFIQIFTGRETDIDDLILNTLGVYIGVIFLKNIKKC
ncbi:MAG: VanZ family protein [Bacilli bacterium]|nr:VanZ family protein [Bacilli bacterium]